MKTYTTKFTDFAKFDKFIAKNSAIFKYDAVLVQIFSGKLEKLFLEDLLCYIQKKIPKAKIIGATTDGEMIENKVLIQSIVISITVFEKTTLTIGYIDNIEGENSFSLGERIALKLEEPDSKVFILFTDNRKINGEDFLSGVVSEAKNITIAGGIAGDNGTFSGSYLMCENRVLENGVVGVSLNSKELEVHTQYSFAWENIGREFIVNKAEKNRVYQLIK